MAYIGKTPQVGNYVKLDAISCSSTNTYNLAQDSVAFTPESALHMMVSLNGVIQAPLTSFSVSGSTITFLPSSGTLSSSDTIDFILVLGNVLDIGTPSDNTVTNAKTNFVSSSSSAGLSIKGDGTSSGTGGKLQLNCSANSHGIKLESPAHSAGQGYTLKFPTGNVTADKFLKVASITGSGTTGVGQLSFADAGAFQKVSSSSTTQTGLSSLLIALPTTTDFTSLKLIIRGLKAQQAATQFWAVRFSSSSSVVTSTSYNFLQSHLYSNDSASGSTHVHDLNASEIRLSGGHTGDGSDDREMTSVEIDIHNSSTNGRYTRGFFKKSIEKRHNDNYHYHNNGSFMFASGNVVDAIQIRISSGNVFTTYGYSLYKTLF